MSAPPTGADPVRRRRLVWVSIVAGVAVVALVALAVSARVTADRERAERDAAAPTAWEDRVEMNQVLIDTARLLGITSDPLPVRETPLTCVRRDGRYGVSYFLHELEGEPLDDPQGALDDVAQFWADAGYAVSGVGGVVGGGVWRVSAETKDGAIVEAATGPGATIVSGETGCFLRDGGPATP